MIIFLIFDFSPFLKLTHLRLGRKQTAQKSFSAFLFFVLFTISVLRQKWSNILKNYQNFAELSYRVIVILEKKSLENS